MRELAEPRSESGRRHLCLLFASISAMDFTGKDRTLLAKFELRPPPPSLKRALAMRSGTSRRALRRRP